MVTVQSVGLRSSQQERKLRNSLPIPEVQQVVTFVLWVLAQVALEVVG